MEWVERTDRTVDAAKDFLLDQLGVDEAEAEFEVLEEPKPGLFGRVRGQARVRARVTPRAPRAKEERRRRPAKGRDGGGGAGNGQRKGGRTTTKSSSSEASAPEPESSSGSGTPPAAPESNGDQGARPQGQGGRPQGRGPRGGDAASAAPVDPAPFIEPLTAFLDELAAAFGVSARTEVVVSDEGDLEAQIVGDGLGALIGPAGGVISAIQELSRTFLQKVAQGGSAPRLRVDVGGYRADRRTALVSFTQEVARTVVETGQAHAFEPMGSVDRKIVHDAAGEVPGVATRSDGEDPARRVVIVKA
jgi:spoIIIJ-associated protein